MHASLVAEVQQKVRGQREIMLCCDLGEVRMFNYRKIAERKRWIGEISSTLGEMLKDESLKGVGDKAWTDKILLEFTQLGKKNRFHVAASKAQGAHWGEWGFDLCWRDYGRPDLIDLPGDTNDWQVDDALKRIPLVLESEWGNLDEIVEDFEKILVSRAELRVLICQDKHCCSEKIRFSLKHNIKRFAQSKSSDQYLVAIYLSEMRKFTIFCLDGKGGVTHLT